MSTCMRIDSAQAFDNVSCCSCSIGFKLNAGECDCKHGHHDGYLCEASFTICGSVKFQIVTITDIDMYGQLISFTQVHAHSPASSQPNPACV